jgi:hypothetical protein
MIIEPYGGRLVDLLEAEQSSLELKAHADTLPSIQLTDRAVCDLELLAVGAFSPVDRFMAATDTERGAAEMRLADGRLFPMRDASGRSVAGDRYRPRGRSSRVGERRAGGHAPAASPANSST